MKKFAFLTIVLCTCGNLMAVRTVSDINMAYNRTNELDAVAAATDRMGYIISQINSIVNSFTLMNEVNAAVVKTNNTARAEAEKEWRRLNPDQEFYRTIQIFATNRADGVAALDTWKQTNMVGSKDEIEWRTNIPSNSKRFSAATVRVHTNWVFTAREKRDYDRLKRQYLQKAYDVIGNLSADDYVTYTNQVEITKNLKRDFKILQDNYKYLQNYSSITNQEFIKMAEHQAAIEKAKAAEIANSLTSEQEDRYYEIIDTMEDLGFMTSDNDINLLRALNNDGKSKRVVSASKSARNAQMKTTLADRVNYIKSLSKEDQRIFRVGNKKLRVKEQLKSELTSEEWAIFNKLQQESQQYVIYSDKLKFVANMTEDEKLIYRSGRRIKLQEGIDAKKAFKDPAFKSRQIESKRIAEYKKAKGYVTEDTKTMQRIRSATNPVVPATK